MDCNDYKFKINNMGIYPTLKCNFNCKHCGFGGSHKDENLTKEDIDFLLKLDLDTLFIRKEVGDRGGRTYTGGGEPTLALDSIYYLETQLKNPNVVNIYTNGWWLLNENDLIDIGNKMLAIKNDSNATKLVVYLSTTIYHLKTRGEVFKKDVIEHITKFTNLFPDLELQLLGEIFENASDEHFSWYPMGNAAKNNLNVINIVDDCFNKEPNQRTAYWYPMLGPGLKIYPCCNFQSVPIGNLYDHSIDEINMRFKELSQCITLEDRRKGCIECTKRLKNFD